MFGAGALATLGDQLKTLGLTKAIIITDKGVTDTGITAKVADVVKDAGASCAVFDGCLSDAPADSIPLAAGAARAAGAEVIIGLGGGSSMDTAKAATLLVKEDKPVTPTLSPPRNPIASDIPIITIATTSGTGSEVTTVAVVSDTNTSAKFGVGITGALMAIVDPELTVGMPPRLTAMTGMDVVAHAVEAITAIQRNPMSDLRGYEALRLSSAHLYDAVKDGSNMTARSGMSFASMLAGMAFNNSATTLGHSISQALSPTLHLHHGLLCGLGTPVQLELFATGVPERVRKVGEIFGADIPYDATPEQIGKITADKMRSFMSLVGLQSFDQLGVSKKDVLDRVDALMQEFMLGFCPITITKDVAVKALEMMFEYKGA